MKSKTLELQAKVRQLREEGKSYKAIGLILNISAAYAHVLDKPEMYQTEEKKSKHRQYRDKSRERNLEYGKQWREKNPEYMKKWYQANKDKYKEYNNKHKEML